MTRQEEIQKLKEEKDAVILAHYYVRPEVQEIADYIGDSYFLSKKAVDLPQRTIVFCGVSFMGESAKLLNPSKTVLMPDAEADCPMAHMVVRETIEKARAQYEDLAVVCYINSTAKIKSWSDVSVTSANAVQIVRNLPNQHILFIPDRNLAHFVAEQVPEKQFVFNEGYCPIHENMRAAELEELKIQHPSARVLVHPECSKEVLSLADYIGSTSGIIQFAKRECCQGVYHWHRVGRAVCITAGAQGCGILFSQDRACLYRYEAHHFRENYQCAEIWHQRGPHGKWTG